MAATARGTVDALAVPPQRPGAGKNPGPGAGKKWSEVCERVQHSDGSVRTPAGLKSSSGATSAVSPPRPRRPTGAQGVGLRRPSRSGSLGILGAGNGGASSRGGSSKGGSSGKSSRSSSRDPQANFRDGHSRDGDISSRCSSGGWETSTNSSEPSRPRTPPNAAPSPCISKGLLMPEPIRTGLVLPPALLEGEQAPEALACRAAAEPAEPAAACEEALAAVGSRPGLPLKEDPFGRDGSRRAAAESKPSWTVEPLAKYLKGVALQIDANLRDERLPTVERLDTFVSKLVSNAHRQLKHAPRKARHTLQAMFSRRFQKFWNFTRNEKVRTTTPEELKWALISLIEHLISEFAVNPDALSQPKSYHEAIAATLRR